MHIYAIGAALMVISIILGSTGQFDMRIYIFMFCGISIYHSTLSFGWFGNFGLISFIAYPTVIFLKNK